MTDCIDFTSARKITWGRVSFLTGSINSRLTDGEEGREPLENGAKQSKQGAWGRYLEVHALQV